eukprot:TRINITY_DN7247_c0_g1_i1.p1 TRINITY_DN7247_c0_g1~~TRINITY_DN7247_c0_g1_i1.p1  ORF type:complete len:209 (+),score=24.38 TRINITY_DN7247_c0_g1_i1:28-654(+)
MLFLLRGRESGIQYGFFFSSRRRHTRCREVSWARRCVQETVSTQSTWGMPSRMPGGMPDMMPSGIPGGMPGMMPSGMPGGMSGGMPGKMPGKIPDMMPSGIPGGMPGGMPGMMPAGMSGGMPGMMPGGMSGGMPGGMLGNFGISSGGRPGVPQHGANGTSIEVLRRQFAPQLKQLAEMGLTNERENIRQLQNANGNVGVAANLLLSNN